MRMAPRSPPPAAGPLSGKPVGPHVSVGAHLRIVERGRSSSGLRSHERSGLLIIQECGNGLDHRAVVQWGDNPPSHAIHHHL